MSSKKKFIVPITLMIVLSVLITMGMLLIVWLFEILEIHVPGSREMWVAFIGSICSGVFTLGAVIITINYEKELLREEKRIDNMPMLAFEAINNENINNGKIPIVISNKGVTQNTNFCKFNQNYRCSMIKVSSLNGIMVRDLFLSDIAVNGDKIKNSEEYEAEYGNDLNYVIVSKENDFSFNLIFDYPINGILFVLVRFCYKDMYGNQYYQDLPLNVCGFLHKDSEGIETHICYTKMPVYVGDKKMKSLDKVNKEYRNYRGIFLDDGFKL